MVKKFYNSSAALQYIADNKLPLDALTIGTRGMNFVTIREIGGRVVAPCAVSCGESWGRRYA
tara:strand:- start:13428 stop:13613 length:186 start_codon:yes stop_codon:yes gene_type:complete